VNIQDFPHLLLEMNAGMLTDPAQFDIEPTPSIYSLNSEACRLDHFVAARYRYWCEQLKEVKPRFHRKQWEWVYICAALHERGMLRPGMRGLGFGVGLEPLAELFASMGAHVVATDQAPETAVAGGWVDTNQHSTDLSKLNMRNICPPDQFAQRVTFRHADMNNIAPDLIGFDFCWSSCCYEHLGSIEHGLRFIHNSMRTLKPGGISIHTTELNLSSDVTTFETPHLSLFRKSDFKRLATELRAAGHDVAPMSFYPGSHPLDSYVDLPPFKSDPHLRLEVGGYASTSWGIIVRKG
jgi:2-polyprenyl-3-methyl-5-hydroxy-6-metoxy-1,4-benzoquinol methylase